MKRVTKRRTTTETTAVAKAAKICLFLVVQARAFAPPSHLPSSPLCTSTTHSLHLPYGTAATCDSSLTALQGLRTFFRKRFGKRGGVQEDDVFLFDIETIGNATSSEGEDESLDASFFSGTSTVKGSASSSSATAAATSTITPNEAYITPGRRTPKTTTTTTTTVRMGALQPPTSTFLVQATEVLWSSMAAAASAASTSPATPKVRSSNLRLKRWLPADIDSQQNMPPFPTNRKLTKYETEFRGMLEEFSTYTRRDISHIRNPRLRTLFEGVVSAYSVPEVFRAFEILFEDYAPLRIGGRLVYAHLKAAMMESQLERQSEIDSLQLATGLARDDIDASRIAFLRMAVHDDEKTHLTLQQLIDYGLAETVVEMLGYDYFEEFMQELLYDGEELDELDQWLERNVDPKKKGAFKFGFSELMVALQNCPLDSIEPECRAATVLPEIASRLEPESDTSMLTDDSQCEKKKRHADRYDDMVEDFLQWKEQISPGRQGRKMEVLHGCFAGADREEIVNALRIVYVDYKALRFAGDLIFKVMRAVVMSGTAKA